MQASSMTIKKAKLKTINLISTLMLTGLSAIINTAAVAATVNNISPETLAQYGKENAFWEARVSCDGDQLERVIQRKTDGDNWCPKDIDSLCAPDKDTAAANACSEEYSLLLSQEAQVKEQALGEARQAQLARERTQQEALRREEAQSARRQAATSADDVKIHNKISIQEERIKLDQAKLELRRRELNLERRSVEIEEILKTLE